MAEKVRFKLRARGGALSFKFCEFEGEYSKSLAEEVRFELTGPVKGRRFSRPVQSTALPLFQMCRRYKYMLE
jgi:hypothetical protein